MWIRWGLLFFVLLSSCGYKIDTHEYQRQYVHLKRKFSPIQLNETPYFLVILVEARHLDYTSPSTFFKTLAKHPSDGSKNCDVGHSWIYLQGLINGQACCIEGGHSGELGYLQPKYIEGVIIQYENENPNPISYLWTTQKDGYFQEGSGNHYPTFAAKIDLTEEQFYRILKYIQSYNYSEYAITGNQCSSFVTQVAAFANLSLDCEVTVQINPSIYIDKKSICLWQDPDYSEITFSTPDRLERSLIEAVDNCQAEYALSWYKKKFPRKRCFDFESIQRFPERYIRFKSLPPPEALPLDSAKR